VPKARTPSDPVHPAPLSLADAALYQHVNDEALWRSSSLIDHAAGKIWATCRRELIPRRSKNRSLNETI
jgi:hypothetical protein